MATEELPSSAVLTGGHDGTDQPRPSIGSQRPAAAELLGGATAGPWPTPWPDWARDQLEEAVAVAESVDDRISVARELYREWFNPRIARIVRLPRPLVGVYRAAHAGSAHRRRTGGVTTVQRYDLIGPDGWWRTWGKAWTPPRTRPGSVRLMLTPNPDCLGVLVSTVTRALLDSDQPWSLGCATRPRRIARYGSAVLDVPGLDDLPAGLLDALVPLLRPVTPPLARPVAPGIGLAQYPDNGMTFGEHRCHLVALALRHPGGAGDPLRAIAAVFTAHGIDPAHPYRNR
jgi:hypothetical protein